MKWATIISFTIVALYVIALWEPLVAVLSLYGVLMLATALKTRQWDVRRRERARLLDDCHYEHEAWNRGEDDIAILGRFPLDGRIHPSARAANWYREFGIPTPVLATAPWITLSDEPCPVQTRVLT